MQSTLPIQATVIIVSFNDETIINDCLKSVLDQDFPRDQYEVIVVDNASKDRTVELIRSGYSEVKLIESPVNLGYPAGMNKGLEVAQAKRVVMLSSDTVVPHGWLSALLRPMDEDSMVKVTHAAMVIPGNPGYSEGLAARTKPEYATYHDMSRHGLIVPINVATTDPPILTLHVAGASAALDTSILPELGGYMMDGDFFLDCDEIDLGFRVNSLGYKVLAVPAAAYYHRHPFNTNAKLSRRMATRLLRLQHNKALAFYKNMHNLEWLACLPIFLFGGALKPLVYRERYSLKQLFFNIVGLEIFVWLGFFKALLFDFRKYTQKRRISLMNRRQPPFWFFKQITNRPNMERKHV